MKKVQFTQRHKFFREGRVEAFPEEIANGLIAGGVAVEFAEPVVESKEKPKRGSAE